MRAVIVGAGRFVPEFVVTNAMISKIIPYWSPDRIEEKLGIVERRFMWPLDLVKGMAVPPPPGYPATNVDMAERALARALENAGLTGKDLDALIFVTCTPDEPLFMHDTMALHERFAMRGDAHIIEFNSGCGGSAFELRDARMLIESGCCKRVALVASNATSPCFTGMHIYSEPAFPFPNDPNKPLNMALSAYVFGDGAGALILEGRDTGDSGIISSHVGVGYGVHVFRSGGGIMYPGNARRTEQWRHGYYVDGKRVAIDYGMFMIAAITGALRGHEHELPNIKRLFFHQVNRRILEQFLKQFLAVAKLPQECASIHVDHYANISAPCTLVLMAEDLEKGIVQLGSGELVLLAAMGAGAHYGGHLIRL